MTLPQRPLIDVLNQINAYNTAKPFFRENREKTETWHIADFEVNTAKTKAVLLFSRSDQLAADQAVSEPASKHFSVTAKQGRQGNASSAHLAIRLKPVKPNVYLTVLEEAIGISTKDIESILALIVTKAKGANKTFFQVKDPSGTVRNARYKFAFVGHPSDDFTADLEESTINGIELVDLRARDQVFDEDKYTVEKSKTIKLALRDKDFPIWDALRSVGKRANKEQLDSLRVKFTDAQKSSYTVELDANTLRLVHEDRFVKKERLTGFKTRLNTGCDKIVPEIRDRLFALI
ncbi:hypothetical protein [Massilia sp. BHUDP2]|uniref:hypothetical protein n=1 Tax=Massilia sp. BHUDP2 TaxID=3034505 RepID=UPI003906A724